MSKGSETKVWPVRNRGREKLKEMRQKRDNGPGKTPNWGKKGCKVKMHVNDFL